MTAPMPVPEHNEIPILSWPDLGMVLYRPVGTEAIDRVLSPMVKKKRSVWHQIHNGAALLVARKAGERYPFRILYDSSKPSSLGDNFRVLAYIRSLETGSRRWPGLRDAMLWFAIRFAGVLYRRCYFSRLDLPTPTAEFIGNLKGAIATGKPPIEAILPSEEPLRSMFVDVVQSLRPMHRKAGSFDMFEGSRELERSLRSQLDKWAEERADSSSPVDVVQPIDSMMLSFGKTPVSLLPQAEFEQYVPSLTTSLSAEAATASAEAVTEP